MAKTSCIVIIQEGKFHCGCSLVNVSVHVDLVPKLNSPSPKTPVGMNFLLKKVTDYGSTHNTYNQLDPVGSTVRYEMMKPCTGSV